MPVVCPKFEQALRISATTDDRDRARIKESRGSRGVGRGEGEELVYGRFERTRVTLNLSEKKFSLECSDGGGGENMKSTRTFSGVRVVQLGPKKVEIWGVSVWYLTAK